MEKYANDLKKLGNNIRLHRERAGLSQEALGFKADLHRTYISQLELGQRNPSYTTLCKLANALNVSIYNLIGK
ncbi:anaerobic benzoate catabolism transcriptional regulator [Desulfosporosinus acididurans]|uniref:Anaerobic benzoate catabolism transcriptional regulator n=1 Tax=Desulfosporosinus acididurans TaxID=476652 RepID=A0A0J1ISC2_9FIRM|nr:helix-turn-helix transcriptional regulator [Desulfosporosinus acididurans]KLU67556.1 anaerobic benzoate catabolism transcriptional regulator [Desulfosporosinus acididurans]